MSSLTSALTTARSGLDATQVWSEVTSNNIANTNTQGYVRKEVNFSTTSVGQGGAVQVTDVQRDVNTSLDQMYWSASSQVATQQAIYEGVQAYTSVLGQPSDQMSPVTKLTNLQTAFDTLANSPDSAGAQQGALDAAKAMATSLNTTSGTLNEVKGEVTTEIKYNVTDVNQALYKIAALNKQVAASPSGSVLLANLQDQLGTLVQTVAQQMNVQVSTDSTGQLSLYTAGGTTLVQGQQVNDLRYDSPSGKLYAGSQEITPGTTGVRGFTDGSLAGLFQLQNTILPTFQRQLDNLAANLIQGFQAQDASLAPGQAGLFTDAGAAYNAANIDGLAGRIAINAAVDPAQGGTLSRIRDGIGAATPGPTGDSTQVNAFLNVFTQATTNAPGTNLPNGMTMADYTSNMVSYQQVAGTNAQKSFNDLQTSAQTINASRQSVEGVNLDNELQNLIVIQHNYAANAKVMGTISTMMDALIQAVQ